MSPHNKIVAGISVLLMPGMLALADIKVTTDHNNNDSTTAEFKFANVPPPSRNDSATAAKITIVTGEIDAGSGGVNSLNNGRVPDEADQPEENFFFQAGTDGGRVLFEFKGSPDIQQVNTYSWHPGTRGPQVYTLYASDGNGSDFNAKPDRKVDPETCGWKKIARVDTRPKSGDLGGQYGVSITGTIGTNRYLLFDILQTENDDSFGNTFYSEIDVVDKNAKVEAAPTVDYKPLVLKTADGKCEFTIDTAQASDLTDWTEHKLAPIMVEWYPKIAAMLPSEGYSAPEHFSLIIKPGRGVAATSGTRITANASWIRSQMDRQSAGSIVHEMVHVVQQYGRARRRNPDAAQNPGWLVEGVADYIRWYKYEPGSHGADIKPPGADRARYDGSYRPTANFLNWVTEKYDKDIVKILNAAMRDGKYSENIWQDKTGMTLQKLGEEWKKNLQGSTVAPGTTNQSSKVSEIK